MEWEIGRCIAGTQQARPAALSVWARHLHGPDAVSTMHAWVRHQGSVEPGEYGIREAGTATWEHLFSVTDEGAVASVEPGPQASPRPAAASE